MPWIVLGVVIVAALALVGGKAVIDARAEAADSAGICHTPPTEIASAHGVSLDVEALARMGVSEAGSSAKAQTAVMAAALNQAKAKDVSISTLLLRSRTKAGLTGDAEGLFSGQNHGKYASTRLASTSAARTAAQGLLSGKLADPTGGARQWDAPAAQDAMVGKVAGYTKTAADVAAERSKTSVQVDVPGVTAIRFWRPKTGAA